MFGEVIGGTIERFEATGSSVITDGEQRKYHNFGTRARGAEHRARIRHGSRWPEKPGIRIRLSSDGAE